MRKRLLSRKTNHRRAGAAAVELAVASPVLVLILLGTIDLGQFINISEVVSNTSRIAARKAVRYETHTVDEVRTAAIDHLANNFSTVSRNTLSDATTVTVKNAGGTVITGTGIANIPSKQDVVVEVTFNFAALRWTGGLRLLDGKSLSCTTTMRRL